MSRGKDSGPLGWTVKHSIVHQFKQIAAAQDKSASGLLSEIMEAFCIAHGFAEPKPEAPEKEDV